MCDLLSLKPAACGSQFANDGKIDTGGQGVSVRSLFMILEHKKRDRLAAVSPKSGTIPKPLSPIQKPRWRISVGPINHAFLSAGGNANEYGAAMHRAVADGWLKAHPSGAYVQLTQKGANSVAGDAPALGNVRFRQRR